MLCAQEGGTINVILPRKHVSLATKINMSQFFVKSKLLPMFTKNHPVLEQRIVQVFKKNALGYSYVVTVPTIFCVSKILN